MRTRGSPLAYVPGLLALLTSVVLAVTLPSESGGFGFIVAVPLVNAWPFLAAGFFAYRAFPQSPVARLLLLAGTLLSLRWAVAMSTWTLDEVGAGRAVVAAAFVSFSMLGFAAFAAVVSFGGLLPDGRVERRYERRALVVVWGTIMVPLLHLLASPGVPIPWWFDIDAPAASPVWIPALSFLDVVFRALEEGVLLLAAAPILLALRYRRGDADRRRKLRGLLTASVVLVMVEALRWFLEWTGLASVGQTAWLSWVAALSLVYIFGAVVVALFKHRLLGAEIVIRRSVIYGFLWASIGAAAVGAAAVVGIVLGRRLSMPATVVVTIVVTLALQPARRRLERVADRWVYGRRWSRYEVVTRFGEVLKDTFDLRVLATRLAETVREGLDVSWARVSLTLRTDGAERAEPVGAAGIALDEDATPALSHPVLHEGEAVASIECGPKREGELTREDRELIETLGRQAALAIRNSKLAAELAARLEEIRRQARELAASRSRLVTAQDAERRRIERNLHDGVQQQIVALVAKLRLARNQLTRDPDLSERTLDELQAEAVETLRDLRELAQGIHPAVLTDQGLGAAVQAAASRMPMPVSLEADPHLLSARFDETVEVAAYYLVTEALANVLKHAHAQRVRVGLSAEDDVLLVFIADDGGGLPPGSPPGSGLRNLRDRVEAVGGTMSIRSGAGEGTVLTAWFPVRVVEEARPV